MAYRAWRGSLPMEKETHSFQLLACWCCAALLGKGLQAVFFPYCPLLAAKNNGQTWNTVGAQKQNVTMKERRTAEKKIEENVLCEGTWKGRVETEPGQGCPVTRTEMANILCCVRYLDQPLLTQWDWKHRDCYCSLRSMGMALRKCHILFKLCRACKIPCSSKTSREKDDIAFIGLRGEL